MKTTQHPYITPHASPRSLKTFTMSTDNSIPKTRPPLPSLANINGARHKSDRVSIRIRRQRQNAQVCFVCACVVVGVIAQLCDADMTANATVPTISIAEMNSGIYNGSSIFGSSISSNTNGSSPTSAKTEIVTTLATDLLTTRLKNEEIPTTTQPTPRSVSSSQSTPPPPTLNTTVTTKIIATTIIASTTSSTLATPPETCADFAAQTLAQQPNRTAQSHLTLCGSPLTANRTNLPANFPYVQATFYDGCIEATDHDGNGSSLNASASALLPLLWDTPCDDGIHVSYIYEAAGNDEQLYVLQNGSLLRIGNEGTEYDVFEMYCLFEAEPQQWVASVCYDRVVSVTRAEVYLYAICMLMSVPCLLVTAFLYLAVPALRNLHGKSLACHSLCMAMGFLLLSAVQLRGTVGTKTGYVIQYLLLACFLWLSVMCIDICIKVWYFIPRRMQITPTMRMSRFLFYATIAQGLPFVFVGLTIHYELSGMPSYFLKGVTVATRSSQQFFIPPISTILFVCFILTIVSFFGFRKLDPLIAETRRRDRQLTEAKVQVNMERLDVHLFEETKQIARSTAYLFIIMTMNWVFEIISFYITSTTTVELFDILNALQGINIFIIFVSLPRPLHIIKRWWSDRGEWDTTEMEQMQPIAVAESTGDADAADRKRPLPVERIDLEAADKNGERVALREG